MQDQDRRAGAPLNRDALHAVKCVYVPNQPSAPGNPRHGSPLVSLNNTAALFPQTAARSPPAPAAGKREMARHSGAGASSPAGTEPLHLPSTETTSHRGSKAQPQWRLLANHRGEDVQNALAFLFHLLLLAKHVLLHLLPTNITQWFPFLPQVGVCTQTCTGKRRGCCKGRTCSRNSEAIYRGSALKLWAGFHQQPHTTLARV